MLTVIVAFIVVAGLVAGCGDDDDDTSSGAAGDATDTTGGEATGEPVKIGLINQEAGAVGTFPAIGIAMQAAVDYINTELNGVEGHPLELVKCVTEGTSESTQQCAEEMVSENPLYVTTGIDFFGVASYPVLQQAGIFAVGALPLSTQESSAENVFFVNAGNASTTVGEAVYIHENLPDVERVTVVTNDNAASQASIPFVQDPLESFGIEVSVVSVPDAQTDYLGPFTQVQDTDPDAIIVNTSPPGCISLASVAASQGNEVPIVSQLTCYDNTMKEQIGAALEGWHIGLLTLDPEGDSEDAELFRRVMTDYVGEDADLTGFSPVGFQTIMTVYNNVLEPTGYDGLVDSATGEYKAEVIQERMSDPEGGELFLGGHYQCGLDPFTAVCDYHSGWNVVGPAPDLALEDQLDGELLDTRDVVTEQFG